MSADRAPREYRKRKEAFCSTTGKLRHPSLSKACVALHRMAGRPKNKDAHKLLPYLCDHCHSWHLGRSSTGDDDIATADPKIAARGVES